MKDLARNIISDDTIILTSDKARSEYPERLRRVTAYVFLKRRWRDMVFLTNNFVWSATQITELYKARLEVELLFKELKQTLQLQDFYGEKESAVKWQVWAALLTHLVLRLLQFKAKANCSYTRFVGFVRAVVWLKKGLMSVLRAYRIAPGGNRGDTMQNMPYLLGLENCFAAGCGIATRQNGPRNETNRHTHQRS